MDILPTNQQQPNQTSPQGPTPPQPINVSAPGDNQSTTSLIPPAPMPENMPAAPTSTSIPVSVVSESPDISSSMSPAPSQPESSMASSMPPAEQAQPMAEQPKASSDNQPMEPTQSAAQPNTMQNPKVFDTNQYHLPIQKSKKHNPGVQMLVFGVVFLAVLLVGGIIALDAGWIDLGIQLPFNLIK